MITTRFRVIMRIFVSSVPLTETNWTRVLSSIYHMPGRNFDGYISSVDLTSDILTIDCYTVEGPEEQERISGLKMIYTDWGLHRRSAVTNAILCHASHLGIKIRNYYTEQYGSPN